MGALSLSLNQETRAHKSKQMEPHLKQLRPLALYLYSIAVSLLKRYNMPQEYIVFYLKPSQKKKQHFVSMSLLTSMSRMTTVLPLQYSMFFPLGSPLMTMGWPLSVKGRVLKMLSEYKLKTSKKL